MSQDQQDRVATRPQPMSDSSLATEILSEADRIIVTVRGQLDVASYSTLALTLAKAIAAGRDEVVVDPEDLDHIDAQDVSLLIRARGLLRFRGQHLVVRSPCTNANVLAACALLDPHAWVERIDRYEAENVS